MTTNNIDSNLDISTIVQHRLEKDKLLSGVIHPMFPIDTLIHCSSINLHNNLVTKGEASHQWSICFDMASVLYQKLLLNNDHRVGLFLFETTVHESQDKDAMQLCPYHWNSKYLKIEVNSHSVKLPRKRKALKRHSRKLPFAVASPIKLFSVDCPLIEKLHGGGDFEDEECENRACLVNGENLVEFSLLIKEEEIDRLIVVVLALVKERNLEELVSEVKQRELCDKGPAPPSSEDEDDDLQMTQEMVSLIDPITLSRIVTPIKGVRCSHLQCFDLESYLQCCCSSHIWQCACCNKGVFFEEIRVSQLMSDILSTHQRNNSPKAWVDLETFQWR